MKVEIFVRTEIALISAVCAYLIMYCNVPLRFF